MKYRPEEDLIPFCRGPRFLLYGPRANGEEINWSFKDFKPNASRESWGELFQHIAQVAEEIGVKSLLAPTPTTFNGQITSVDNLIGNGSYRLDGLGSFTLYRGSPPVLAEGLILAPGDAIAISSADCPTLTIWNEAENRVGVAHCGMLSLVRGVVANLIQAMKVDSGKLKAFIGAGAIQLPYTIGERTNEELRNFIGGRKRIYHDHLIHLYDLIISLLEESGVKPNNIKSSQLCTINSQISLARNNRSLCSQHLDHSTEMAGWRNLVIVHHP